MFLIRKTLFIKLSTKIETPAIQASRKTFIYKAASLVSRKEYRKAFVSALSAVFKKEVVENRGHRLGSANIPIVFAKEFENISRTREVVKLLEKIGLEQELERIYGRPRVRCGKSKWRGRRLRRKVGPLIVVNMDGKLMSKML